MWLGECSDGLPVPFRTRAQGWFIWGCARACSDCSQIGAPGCCSDPGTDEPLAELVALFSDSAYFVDGAAGDREHAFASGNGDLWQRYWQSVDRHLGCVLVVRVKAHAEPDALSMGHIEWWHFAGNHFADRLANRGAESAALPEATVSALLAVEATAWQVQSRLACILAHIATNVVPTRGELEARDRARAEARSTRELAKPPVLSLEQAFQATAHRPHT